MGRLMKYELRSMLKLFIPLWLGVLALALINRFTLERSWFFEVSDNRLMQMLSGIAMFLYVIGMIGIVIFALIYVILRFYQGLMKDEGYLTFTLPVTVDSILWGKALSALVVTAVSTVVCMLSLLLMLVHAEGWNEFWDFMHEAAVYLGGGNMALMILLWVLVLLVGAVTNIFHVYLAMGIGQLAQKHRIGASVLAYVGINVALSMISGLALTPLMQYWVEHLEAFQFLSSVTNVMQAVWIGSAAILACSLILAAIFYFPTRYIFLKRLNLE